MLRAGPFSDERVIAFVNRRFVPFYFDLSDRGAAGDAAARAFVVAKKPGLGGRSVSTPPVLIMTPSGEVLGEVSNYASTGKMIAQLRRVLDEHSEWNQISREEWEAAVNGYAYKLATILAELFDYDAARDVLEGRDDARTHLILAKIARWEQDWETHAEHVAKIEGDELARDKQMELGLASWFAGDFDELSKRLADFPEEGHRATEARYYRGLAAYHSGDVAGARDLWKTAVETCSQDPWIYRADWAHSQSGEKKKRTSFSSGGSKTLLGRIGYMGRQNPDLEGPPK